MDNKIKVALCLSGEPRSSMFCFPYIYEAFLKPNPLFKTDTYIHSWKNFRALDLYNPKNYKIQNTNDGFIGDIINTLNFSPSLQEQLSYYNLHTKSTNFLFNQIKMFYSIKECFNLIQEDYDIIIRCRYDLIFLNRDFIQSIIYSIINNDYNIFIPYSGFPKINQSKGYNDQLAIGDLSSMNVYSNIINHLPSICYKVNRWDGEVFIKHILDNNNNIKVSQSFINHKVVRQSDVITNKINPNNFLDE